MMFVTKEILAKTDVPEEASRHGIAALAGPMIPALSAKPLKSNRAWASSILRTA